VVAAQLVTLEVVAVVQIRKQYAGATNNPLVAKDTATELRFSVGSSRTCTIDRAHLAKAVRLHTPSFPAQVQFLDPDGHQRGILVAGWMVPSITKWIAALGYQEESLQGRATIGAVQPLEGWFLEY
jgi:hypothetical protein